MTLLSVLACCSQDQRRLVSHYHVHLSFCVSMSVARPETSIFLPMGSLPAGTLLPGGCNFAQQAVSFVPNFLINLLPYINQGPPIDIYCALFFFPSRRTSIASCDSVSTSRSISPSTPFVQEELWFRPTLTEKPRQRKIERQTRLLRITTALSSR